MAGAGSVTADEHEDLPSEVAEIAGVETDEDKQKHRQFHPGWAINIDFTTADYRPVRPGDLLYVFCSVRNDNQTHTWQNADVSLITTRRKPEIVNKKTISVQGQSSSQVTIDYQTHRPGPRRFDIWVVVNGPGRYDSDRKTVELR